MDVKIRVACQSGAIVSGPQGRGDGRCEDYTLSRGRRMNVNDVLCVPESANIHIFL